MRISYASLRGRGPCILPLTRRLSLAAAPRSSLVMAIAGQSRLSIASAFPSRA